MRPIIRPGHDAWHVLPVARAAALIDGEDYYRAFRDAALGAERSILMAGWQFDSSTCLVRGPDAEGVAAPTELLPFLSWLCDRRPDLRVYLLAWNFHVVFALEREWLQELVFNWKTNDRIRFHFDGHHPDSASHHQKFVVIDGQRSFLGGLDLCDHRWDRRKHCEPDDLRHDHGRHYNPFHDAQVYLEGPEVGAALTELFRARWEASGGKPAIDPGEATLPGAPTPWMPKDGVPIAARSVALSRTDPFGAPEYLRGPAAAAEGDAEETGIAQVREVESLHVDAIAAAERSIYIETQYFSSRAVGNAIVDRLRDVTRPLDLVIVTNPQAESPKETLAIGLAQAKVLREIRKAADRTPHTLALVHALPECEGEAKRSVYIHAKLMVVDDRFVTIGSANLTNRSMGLDSELHASFEVGLGGDADDGALEASIRALRCGLVREHLGVDIDDDGCTAANLLAMIERGEGRLRPHPQPTAKELEILDVVDPMALPFDPDGIEDSAADRSLFIGGIDRLWTKLAGAVG